MNLIATILLAVLMLASVLGIARSREHPDFDRLTSRLSHFLAIVLGLPTLAYLSVNHGTIWLLPFFGLLQLEIISIRTHSRFAEFTLLPLITSQVYALIFFEGIRNGLSGSLWLLPLIAVNALGLEGLRRALETMSLKIGRMHWK